MIKSHEVHIGNYFNVPRKDQSPFRVDLMEYVTADFCKVGMNVHKFEFRGKLIDGHPLTWEIPDLEGIPLTKRWMQEFGFTEKKQDNRLVFVFSRFKFIYKPEYKYWYTVSLQSLDYLYKIEFVHELQNFIELLDEKQLKVSDIFLGLPQEPPYNFFFEPLKP